MMSIFDSALPDLTAGVTFKPVVNRLMGIHESDLYDNAIINRSKHIPDFVKDRIKHSHMSLTNTLKVARLVDLTSTREILLIHISDGNADDRKFVREMRAATGKRCYAAHPGLVIDYSIH